jgi:hypothetical protein
VADAFALQDAAGGSSPFTLDSADPQFWLGEPIWLTAQKAGKRAITASWPGAQAPLQRGTCARCSWNASASAVPFDASQDAATRVDVMLAKLSGSQPCAPGAARARPTAAKADS